MLDKNKYIGDHGGKYTDINNMTKQFTYIDHDKKTRISKHEKKDVEELRKSIKNYTINTIKAILSLPPVNLLKNSNGLYEEFIIRDQKEGILWNEPVLINACSINDMLRHNIFIHIWRNSVKEEHWFEDISNEDIIKGEWKKWSIN